MQHGKWDQTARKHHAGEDQPSIFKLSDSEFLDTSREITMNGDERHAQQIEEADLARYSRCSDRTSGLGETVVETWSSSASVHFGMEEAKRVFNLEPNVVRLESTLEVVRKRSKQTARRNKVMAKQIAQLQGEVHALRCDQCRDQV
jgi:hypothetical protein